MQSNNNNDQSIRVVLIAPRIVLWGLKELLEFAGPQFQVVAGASTLREAREAVQAAEPDAVVVDAQVPLDREQLLSFLAQCPTPVIVLTGRDDFTQWQVTPTDGLRGVVCTDEPPGVLLQAIEAVSTGASWTRGNATGEPRVKPQGTKPTGRLDPGDKSVTLIQFLGSGNRWGGH